MDLQVLWFCLLAFFFGAYFVLEGFDFGVGLLLPFLPRNEEERSTMFRTIGPVWDGNEVWLVIAGAATFAAFPAWYATWFSGFYIALLLLLVFLIVRVVSFEWREKSESTRWLGLWTWANTIGSLGIALIWGVAFSNLLYGVPINSSGDFAGDFWDLFNLYTLLGGVAAVVLFAFHGATYLTLRTTGELCRRAAAAAGGLSIATAVVGAGFMIWTVVVAVDRNDKDVFPPLLPAATRDRRAPRRRRLRAARAQRLGVRAHGGRRLPRRGDDLHEPLPARHGRQQRLRQQPHRRQRVLGALHAQGDDRRGADRHAAHPALPGVDVPRLPREDHRRGGAAPRRRERRRACRLARPLTRCEGSTPASSVVHDRCGRCSPWTPPSGSRRRCSSLHRRS